MRIRSYALIVILVLAGIVLLDSIYILDQRQSALILKFGEPVHQELKPGLKFKVPFINNVVRFDRRIQNISFNPDDSSELLAMDQKTMKLDAFAKYRIIDPLKFYQTVFNERTFKVRMSSIIESSIRESVGSVPFHDILGVKRQDLMKRITEVVNSKALDFGVKVVDVRIVRLNLPDRARTAVYARMKTEREKEAKEIRAEGSREAEIITANADREKAIILAKAKQKAEAIKGDGDSEATKVYSMTYGKDQEFFEFYRSLEAYKKAIGKDNSSLLLNSNSDFFKYLNKQGSKKD